MVKHSTMAVALVLVSLMNTKSFSKDTFFMGVTVGLDVRIAGIPHLYWVGGN